MRVHGLETADILEGGEVDGNGCGLTLVERVGSREGAGGKHGDGDEDFCEHLDLKVLFAFGKMWIWNMKEIGVMLRANERSGKR